jgi:hypothetical protein
VTKRTLALFFFSLAVILATGLAVVEFSSLIPKYFEVRAGAHCKVTEQQELSARGSILWSNSSYFVAANSPEGEVSLFSWSMDPHIQWKQNSRVSLYCETPKYSCLPRKDFAGKAVGITIEKFTPPQGVAAVEFGAIKKLFPFSWDSKEQATLGSPLAFCGRSVDLTKMETHLTPQYLVAYEPRRSLLAFYTIANLKGSLLQAAEVEPDSLYQVSGDGILYPGTCDEMKGDTRSGKTFLHGDHLLILTSSHHLRIINIARAVVPVPVDIADIQAVLNFEKDGFWVRGLTAEVRKLTYSGQVASVAPKGLLPEEIRNTSGWAIWSDRIRAVQLRAESWFSPYEVTIQGEDKLSWDWTIYRSPSQLGNLIFLNKNRFAVLNQRKGSSGNFSLIECE